MLRGTARVVIDDHSRVLRLQYLREIAGLTPHRDFSKVCIAELSLYRYELHQPALEAVLSVLPQSRAIDTVTFATFHSPMASHTLRDFDVADWAWLGFAMFHPDAPTSAWQKLKVDLGTITRAKLAAAFACMARGNNLLAALSGAGAHGQSSCQSHNANTNYYTATLRAGTDVFTSPHGFEATILPGEMTADLCVSSCDPSTSDERVGVVVPGLGLGWIDRQSIASAVVARPPCANAALRHLEIRMIHQGSSIVKSLIALLQLVGANQETLLIQQCGPVADSQQLYDLVKHCPKLTSLAVSHDGSAWSEVSTLSTHEIARLPQLSHLQLLDDAACLLYKPPSQASIAHSLRKLQTLTLTGSSSSSSFIHNREAIQTLLQDHQELRYLNWENAWTRRSQRYEQGRQQAWALLLPADGDAQDDDKKRRMLFTRGALTRECRAAFLSVVARNHDDIITLGL